jgi:hypothetical protein
LARLLLIVWTPGQRDKSLSKKIPVLTCWFIWNERNKVLFDGKTPSAWAVVYKILGALNKNSTTHKLQRLRLSPIIRINGYTLAFFYGASIAGGSNCGIGGTIKCLDSLAYRWYFNCGDGSNTKAELLGAWATLTIAKHLDIQYIQILGDSKVIIDWLNLKGNLQAINIEG